MHFRFPGVLKDLAIIKDLVHETKSLPIASFTQFVDIMTKSLCIREFLMRVMPHFVYLYSEHACTCIAKRNNCICVAR